MVASESEEEGIYPFRRNRNCDYYKVRNSILRVSLGHILITTKKYSSRMLKVSVIGPGNLLKTTGLVILNTDII